MLNIKARLIGHLILADSFDQFHDSSGNGINHQRQALSYNICHVSQLYLPLFIDSRLHNSLWKSGAPLGMRCPIHPALNLPCMADGQQQRGYIMTLHKQRLKSQVCGPKSLRNNIMCSASREKRTSLNSIKCHRSASLVSHFLLISHLKDDLNGKHSTLLRVWNRLWFFYCVVFKESDFIHLFFSFFIYTHFLHTQGYEWLSVNLSVISTFVLPYLPYLLHYYSWARCCILKHSSLPCNVPLSFECMCCTQKHRV